MRLVVTLSLIVIIGGTCGCKESELDSFFSNWTKIRVSPLGGSILLRQAKISPCTWGVRAMGGKIAIQPIPIHGYQRQSETRIKLAAGTLIGEDRGEYGGSLSLLENSNQTPQKILEKNVLQMFPASSGVIVITGDLPANEGSIWFYSDEGGHGWSIRKKADLHGYPIAIGRSGDRILFAFGDAVSVMEQFNEHQIADLPLLDVHPNSIAEDGNGNIYVGMDAFVVRLARDRNGYSQEWFTQGDCLR